MVCFAHRQDKHFNFDFDRNEEVGNKNIDMGNIFRAFIICYQLPWLVVCFVLYQEKDQDKGKIKTNDMDNRQGGYHCL